MVPYRRCSATAADVSASDADREAAAATAVVVGVDETRHDRSPGRDHGRRAEERRLAPTAVTRPSDTSIHPGRNSSAPVINGVGGQQHSDALPIRLRAVGLTVVVDELKPLSHAESSSRTVTCG